MAQASGRVAQGRARCSDHPLLWLCCRAQPMLEGVFSLLDLLGGFCEPTVTVTVMLAVLAHRQHGVNAGQRHHGSQDNAQG